MADFEQSWGQDPIERLILLRKMILMSWRGAAKRANGIKKNSDFMSYTQISQPQRSLNYQSKSGTFRHRDKQPSRLITPLPPEWSEMENGGSPTAESYPIIVHSHLHWDWVWQRPQQVLSRLSARHRILF